MKRITDTELMRRDAEEARRLRAEVRRLRKAIKKLSDLRWAGCLNDAEEVAAAALAPRKGKR